MGLLLRPCAEVWCGFWFVDRFSHLARTARFYSFGNRKFLHKRDKIPMIYDTCVVFFEMGQYCNMFLKKYVRNYQNCSELSRIDPFIVELPNEIWRGKICVLLDNRIS